MASYVRADLCVLHLPLKILSKGCVAGALTRIVPITAFYDEMKLAFLLFIGVLRKRCSRDCIRTAANKHSAVARDRRVTFACAVAGLFGGAQKLFPILEPLLLRGDEVAKKYEVCLL